MITTVKTPYAGCPTNSRSGIAPSVAPTYQAQSVREEVRQEVANEMKSVLDAVDTVVCQELRKVGEVYVGMTNRMNDFCNKETTSRVHCCSSGRFEMSVKARGRIEMSLEARGSIEMSPGMSLQARGRMEMSLEARGRNEMRSGKMEMSLGARGRLAIRSGMLEVSLEALEVRGRMEMSLEARGRIEMRSGRSLARGRLEMSLKARGRRKVSLEARGRILREVKSSTESCCSLQISILACSIDPQWHAVLQEIRLHCRQRSGRNRPTYQLLLISAWRTFRCVQESKKNQSLAFAYVMI